MTDIVPATRPATVVARLTKRSEYLQAARGVRTSRRGFLLQSMPRPGAADGPPRFGFTVTKKIGNAVVRNRIRRRLKEAVRLQGAMAGTPGIDYVLIGRTPALDQPFAALMADVADAIAKAGRGSPKAGGSGRSPAGDRRQSDDARKRAIDG